MGIIISEKEQMFVMAEDDYMPSLNFSERIIVNEFKQKNSWICYYCNKTIANKTDLTVDHKTPLSRGGITEEINLAISCVKCNREKDNMTESEYLLFKDKKLNICGSFGVVGTIEKLISIYDSFISDAQTINLEYLSEERNILNILDKIGNTNFNAYQGYQLAKELRETVKRRNYLKTAKEAYNTLHPLIGNNKKYLLEVNQKIMNTIVLSQYKNLKANCIGEK